MTATTLCVDVLSRLYRLDPSLFNHHPSQNLQKNCTLAGTTFSPPTNMLTALVAAAALSSGPATWPETWDSMPCTGNPYTTATCNPRHAPAQASGPLLGNGECGHAVSPFCPCNTASPACMFAGDVPACAVALATWPGCVLPLVRVNGSLHAGHSRSCHSLQLAWLATRCMYGPVVVTLTEAQDAESVALVLTAVWRAANRCCWRRPVSHGSGGQRGSISGAVLL